MACADWLDASCELVFGRLIHAYRSNKTQRTPMAGRRRFVVPAGWVARGFRFEVEPTSPEQRSRIAQQFGGRRFAHNWALAQVKANLDACQADPGILLLAWNAYRLRKQWNQAKHQVAPWWRACSKEAYASGIADLVQGAAQLVGRQARPSDRTAGRVPPGSRPATATVAGCASPLGQCAWSPTAATSCCQWSGGCAARRIPGGYSGWSSRAGHESCR
jgi:hypothetical protein